VEALSTRRKDKHESLELLELESPGFTYSSFATSVFIEERAAMARKEGRCHLSSLPSHPIEASFSLGFTKGAIYHATFILSAKYTSYHSCLTSFNCLVFRSLHIGPKFN
jgi:hypothetical protein